MQKRILAITILCAMVFWTFGPAAPTFLVRNASAGVPTYSGGGPGDGQNYVPLYALIDVNASEAVSLPTVTTSNVKLYACPGETLASSCTSPNTSTNLCAAAVPHGTTNIECVLGGQLTPETTYKFIIGTGLHSSSTNQGAAAEFSRTFRTSSFNPQNNTTPPFITGNTPGPGTMTFPTNGNLTVEFSAPMIGDGTANSVANSANIVLKTVSQGVPTGSNICASNGCILTFDFTTRRLTINPATDLTASTDYMLEVKGNVANTSNVSMGPSSFNIFFRTGTGADTSALTVVNTFPATVTTGVPATIASDAPSFMVQFSKAVNESTLGPSTILLFKDNGAGGGVANDYTKQAGEPALTDADLTFNYMFGENSLRFGFKTLLDANIRYCVRLLGGASGVKDTIGNEMVTVMRCFQTGDAVVDNTPPTVMFADADNYGLWIQFSEPVDASASTTASSVLNKNNYSIQNPVGATVSLAGANLEYRPEAMGIKVNGLGLQTGQQFQVTVTNVKDRANNAIANNGTTNVGKGMVQNAQTTGGFIGGFDVPNFNTNTNFGNFWINPKRCSPMTQIAGKTTKFTCEFQTPAALATNSTISLTFPAEFNISAAAASVATSSMMNADLNGPGPGVTTISSVAVNNSVHVITLTLNHTGTAMGSGDQLAFELKNIVNPASIGEKSVTAVVKDANGVKQGETIAFAPFQIGTAGSRSISGTVCKGASSGGACGGGDTGLSGAKVFLDFQGGFGSGGMGGHQEATTDGSGDFTFTELADGQYGLGLFIDPSVSAAVGGGSLFQPITLSGGNKADADFKLTDLSVTGKTLTVNITGGPASTDLDVFCFAPGNSQFSAPINKMLTTDGAGAVTSGNTLTLQQNTTYNCGVGPHIPFDSMMGGGPPPVPDFSFMPPEPVTVNVGAIDLAITFALLTTDSQIIGKVTDGSGNGIANVFVNAFPTGCFDPTTGDHKACQGGFAQTKNDGSFVLKVIQGQYQISSCAPGMPCSEPVEVMVKADTGNVATDGNSTADVYKNGTLITGTGITIKLNKTSTTIAGTVQDENGVAIPYASVNAQKVTSGDTCTSFTPTGGATGSPTDDLGSYTLFAGAGTWRVSAMAPAYGQVACSIITVSSSSLTGQILKATAANYGTISGTVTKGGTATQGAHINCYGSAGGNQASSGADGSYSMKVKTGSGYTCEGFIDGAGQLTPQTNKTVASGETITVNLSMTAAGTMSVNLGATITEAFCDARDSSGRGNGTSQNNNGVYTLYAPTGSYTVRCGNPKYGEIVSTSTTVTAGQTTTINATASAPTLYAITGRVTDGSANLSGATVTFTDQTNGRMAFIQSDASTGSNVNVSVSLPAGTYSVIASKSGYVDMADPQSLVISAAGSFTTRALTRAQASVALTVQSGGSNYTGTARVVATDANAKAVTVEVDKTVSSGANATLVLTNGTWTVNAFADNGKKTGSATTITVASNTPSPTSATLNLNTAITGFTASETSQQSLTPSAGGTFRNANIGTNFEVSIPSTVLSTNDSSNGSIETKFNPSFKIDTKGKRFVGAAAIQITPKDSSGKELKEFASNGTMATIKIPYTDADVTAAGVTEGDMVVGAWDESAQEWETLPTTVDTVNNVLTAQATHFSTFAPIGADMGAPATPAGLTAVSGGTSSINLSWTAASGATSYDIYRSTTSGGQYSRLGSEPTVASGDTTSYSDTGLPAATTYYYKISALNGSGESAASNAVSGGTQSGGVGGSPSGNGTPGPSASVPTNTSVVINNGAANTAGQTVTLKLQATGAAQMMISNKSDFAGAAWTAYASTSAWTLTFATGTKTVYVKYKHSSGGVSGVVTDTIQLVTPTLALPPAAPTTPVTGNQDTVTTQQTLPLTTSPSPAPAPAPVKSEPDKIALQSAGVEIIGLSATGPMYVGQKLNYTYKYKNGKTTFKGTVTRELVNEKGKVVRTSKAVISLKPGTIFTRKISESLAAPLALGKYTVRITVKNKVGKTVASANFTFRLAAKPKPAAAKPAAPMAFAFTNFLSLGSKGEEVRQLQVKLKALGYLAPDVDVTGNFGQLTVKAVLVFQKAKGIAVVGYVGPQTRLALNAAN